jgi:tetratricopeptide (TPR) repeat protein
MAALVAATSAPASLFKAADGAVAPGMAANLILLDANPLESIGKTRDIRAIVVRGELFDRDRLDSLLEHVRENKDNESGPSLFEQLESACRADETAECLEELAGYQFSKARYVDARSTYQEAIDAGAGKTALEGLFSSTVNVLFEGGLDCSEVAGPVEALLQSNAGDADKAVGVLGRILPTLGAKCAAEETAYLRQLAESESTSLSDEMRPIYREYYASYLFKVEGDEEAAYQFRVEGMPAGWEEDPVAIQQLAGWCLAQKVTLPKARELAQLAARVSITPIDRLQSMMLEARIASALGDHDGAVGLMEYIDQAVPNNATVTGLLEMFRKLGEEE